VLLAAASAGVFLANAVWFLAVLGRIDSLLRADRPRTARHAVGIRTSRRRRAAVAGL